MASMQRSDTTNLSSPDAGAHNVGGGASHRSFGGAGVDKSHSFRESHEGRVSSGGGGGPSAAHGEAVPLTSLLFLDSISLPSAKSTAQVELRRAMNAATGQAVEDPSLGNIQSRALESCSAEEIKRVKGGLVESANRARERVRHLAEAVIKVDRYNAMQSRKRNRADGGGHDRASHGGAGARGAGGLGHVAKGSGRGASSSGEGSGVGTGSGAAKGGDKSKSGVINKRMRTSLADARPEGRPSNLSVQRSSGVQERERESPRPSGMANGSVDEKERGSAGGGEGWEKTKLKGRRSATVKAEASSGVSTANGTADGEREAKGSGVQHRVGGGEGRAPRPSEGHGFRSGPVHGSLSVQKAESFVLANGSGIRGGSKLEGNVGAHSSEKVDRHSVPGRERERPNGKGVAKPVGREEARAPSPGIVPKAKGARAPRSNLVGGVLARSSSFADVREKALVTSPVKAQAASGPMNRKRAAPSRSSSPPVASWGSSRPQKKARGRRVNVLPPVSISGPAREEANGVEEAARREGGASGAVASSRAGPAGTVVGGNVARRASGGPSGPQTKAQTQTQTHAERVAVCVGPAVSEVSLEEGSKRKGRRPKAEDEEGEQQKGFGTGERSGSVAVAMSRGAPVSGSGAGAGLGAADESGGGDGVRRQGRTGRGPGTPRVAAVGSPAEKVAVSAAMTKPSRVGRPPAETKSAGVGRPAKNGNSDRKLSSRPRRLLNSNGTEFSGEEDDDHELLSRAVQQAVESSESACPNSFWRQVEPYFAYVTAEDVSYLRRHMAMGDEANTTSQFQSEGVVNVKSPFGGDRVSDSEEVKNWNSVREGGRNEGKLRRGRGGGWYDKVFPLSQLVASAMISEREDEDGGKAFGDSRADGESDCGVRVSKHSEMEYDGRDGEGESDVDNLRAEWEWWSTGGGEGGYGMRGGPGSRVSAADEEGDDVVVGSNGRGSGGADVGNGARDREAGPGGQSGNGPMEWEEQYRRMSLDERLRLELSSIGLLPGQRVEEQEVEVEVDDVGEELRRLERELGEQAWRNKEQLCKLEGAVLEKKGGEERAREKLAMDKLVELAHKKKPRGRSAKGAGAKGAKLAALAVAKRVLARVHEFEGGHSCLTDPALRDRLLCVPPSLVESTPDAAMDAGAVATTAKRVASPTGGAGEGGFFGGEGVEDGSLNGASGGVDLSRVKEDWASRIRDREGEAVVDVFADRSTRELNSLSSNGVGGMKGKRSEREREGKVKEARGPNGAKGERKAKTKPRQKTGPLMKAVQGLGAKAAEQQSGKGRPWGPAQGPGARGGAGLDVRAEDGALDLTGIPMPGMEEMSMDQADIGSWLDFALEDPVQSADDGLMGLDIPMDDLSGLMMI